MCGGDLYEHDRFTRTLSPLSDRSSPSSSAAPSSSRRVTMISGRRASLYAQADWSSQRPRFPGDSACPVSLSDGLTLWGAAHQPLANTNGFLDGFAVDRGGIHIALFHGSEQGALGFQEQGKVPHAPFRFEQIRAAGLHHALLGHFHRPRGTEYSTYPGQPRSARIWGGRPARGGADRGSADGSVTQDWREVAPRTMRGSGETSPAAPANKMCVIGWTRRSPSWTVLFE